jgi:hypothetical protein
MGVVPLLASRFSFLHDVPSHAVAAAAGADAFSIKGDSIQELCEVIAELARAPPAH